MKIRSLFFLAIITVLLGVVTTCEDTDSPTNRQGDTENKYGPTYTVPGGTLAVKLQCLESNAVSNTNYIIEVVNDEFINPQYLYFSGRTNITIQLKGIGGIKNIGINGSGSLFTIRNNVTLILKENIVLNESNDNYTLVNEGGGTFIMEGGKIYSVRVDGGTFTMNGGEISGNGVGVHVDVRWYVDVDGEGGEGYKYGVFIMTGGTISGNTAYNGGGVLVKGGTFSMTGGVISGNTAYAYGGGVYVESSSRFEKTGGIITGYSSDTVSGNVVKDSDGNVLNDQGHAVVVASRNYNSDPWSPIYEFSIMKRKDTTAGEQDNLSYVSNEPNPPTISGAWDE